MLEEHKNRAHIHAYISTPFTYRTLYPTLGLAFTNYMYIIVMSKMNARTMKVELDRKYIGIMERSTYQLVIKKFRFANDLGIVITNHNRQYQLIYACNLHWYPAQ